MNSQSIIRTADRSDLEAVLDLYTHLHEHDEPVGKPALLSAWEDIIQNTQISLYILEIEGTAISSCMLMVIPNITRRARSFGLIENVVTRKEYRNSGYATRIISHALNHSWEKNCYKVMLMTGRKQEAVFHLYEKCGFQRGIKEGLIAFPPE